jgi:uncharacterized protein (DUF305 family)
MFSTMGAAAALTAGAMAQITPTQQQAEYEIWFLESMIDHQAQAIQIANMSQGRTDNPYILEAAASVVNERSEQIQTMQNWLQNWYGVSYQPNPSNAGAALVNLSGPSFDWAFMNALARNNNIAVREAARAQTLAVSPDLQSAASFIASDQSTENAQMRNWNTAWSQPATYGQQSLQPTVQSVRGPFLTPVNPNPNMNYLFQSGVGAQIGGPVTTSVRGPFLSPVNPNPNMNSLFRTGPTTSSGAVRGPFLSPANPQPNMNYLFGGRGGRAR